MTIYLNHAGTSWPKPAHVRKSVTDMLNLAPRHWNDAMRDAHQTIATYIGLPDTTRLLLTPGCTSALALAVADLPWQEGDRVLCSGWEHHALHRPLMQLAARRVDLEVLPHRDNHPLDLDVLKSRLLQGRVRLVAITAASNVTGDLLPFKETIQLAHQYGARVLD